MIITLAQYKTLTNTSSTANDTYISNLLAPVQSLIEVYLDRKLDSCDYFEWVRFNNPILTTEYPLNTLKFIGSKYKVATFSNTDTETYNYSINSVGIDVMVDSTFTTTSFLFATYATLTALKTAIEAAFPFITMTIETGYTTLNYRYLKEGTGVDIYGAKRLSTTSQIFDNRTLKLSECNFLTDCCVGCSDVYIIYNAGYTATTMPPALQLITANIIKNILTIDSVTNAANAGGNVITGLLQSETIGNYSYSLGNSLLGDSISLLDIGKVVARFEADLYPWRKKTIGDSNSYGCHCYSC